MKLQSIYNQKKSKTPTKYKRVSASKIIGNPDENPLLSSMKVDANKTTTENGALTFKSSNSKVLDLFSNGGAMRSASVDRIESAISAAWAEDSLLTLKVIFYLRNIRGTGQGERRFFRVAINWLAKNERAILHKNIEHIAKFGRWDDVVSLIDTPASNKALEVIKSQFAKDIENYDKGNFKDISLLAKWMKSENASSKTTKALASKTREYLGLNSSNYRKILSALRAKLNVVERDMTSNNWKNINYQVVPSRASSIYSKAFRKHDPEGYQTFLDRVKTGEAKINASTLYPYDLVNKVRFQSDATADAQWKALPDYCEGSDANSLVVVDVSGSMNQFISDKSKVTCMDVAISMGLYFGERISGPFKNHFITFSDNPTLQAISGSTLRDKAKNLERSQWGMSTNIQSVFNLVLRHAIGSKIKQSDMPNSIVIVSDMQFNVACKENSKTNFQTIRSKYDQAGYKMPQLVFWQVNSRETQSPVTKDQNGVSLVSGCSPSVFRYVCNGVMKSPYDIMLDTLNDSIFDCLSV